MEGEVLVDYDVFMSYAVPILGIAILAIPICIGLAYLIGYAIQRMNIKRGLDKDSIDSPISKISLVLMISLFSIAFIGGAIIFVVGSLLGWESPI